MEMKINTPNEIPVTKVIEKTASTIISRHQYSTGLILNFVTTAGEVKVSSNYNWILETDGSYSPDYDSKNENFTDIQ